MRKFLLFFVLVLAFFIFMHTQSYATPSCGGSITCAISYPHCVIQNTTDPCNPGEPACSCSYLCDGGQTQTSSCSFNASCTQAEGQTFCDTGCPAVGAVWGYGCFVNPDACQVAGDCGANRTCCGGTPNYCSNSCQDCAGNNICSTPTPTPTSGPTCNGAGQYGPCSPNGATAPSSDPNGYYSCSGGCWGWVNTGGTPTPTPSSGVAPTPSSTPVDCGAYGGCAGTMVWGLDPNSGVCGCYYPTPPPAFPPICTGTANGGSCSNTLQSYCDPFAGCFDYLSNNCCSGYCNGTTCADYPTCSGCQAFNNLANACQDSDALCSSGQTCVGGVCQPKTYSISGNIFVDTDQNGSKGAGESNYTGGGASISVSPGGSTSISSGNYTFTNLQNSTYSITFTAPSGYTSTSTNPRSVTVNNANRTNINFGIHQAVPSCVGGLDANPVTVNPGSTSTLSVTSCSNVPAAPPSPFAWIPDNPPGANNPAPTVSGQTDTSTSSTTTWTAPACPASTTIYNPQVTVGTAGNTVSYTTPISVPGTVSVTANVREVAAVGSCNSTSGNAYSNGGTGATLNITNGGTVNSNQTTNSGTGATAFTCLPQGNYQLSLQVPSGYTVVGTDVTPAVESPLGSNGVSFATGSSNQVATFCIAPLDPWFQTSVGDVRILNLSNPVPTGLYGSTDANYPGIFYSSDSNANLGRGAASVKNWVINNEYSYNADTENRNGGMSYDFYKSKTKQDGVTITQISSGTFDQTQITGSGVYESPGDLTINLYTHVNGRRVVILVNGNVTINASTISIPQNQGIFIVAAKGNITIGKTVGTATLNSTASNIDGYYTAQGSIILDGDTCADGTTSDLRLNIGGTLVANSLKPFSITGTGTLQNKRSLCTNNLLYPSLYINARPDFITQLTDFYKTSYTKWQEVNP